MIRSQPKVAAVILAAGGSTRFGQPKQLLPWRDKPLVAHIADTAWSAGLDPVVVVVGAHAERVVPQIAKRPVHIVRNYHWQAGISSSLGLGIATLPADVDAALFLPVDQPLVTPQILQRYVQRLQETGAGIIVPQTADGQRGNPVLFARRHFGAMASLSGDIGGRALFAQHSDDIAYLRTADATWMTDVDTPEAYGALQSVAGASQGRLAMSDVRGLVCDMDGVLWRGMKPLPGLSDFFQLIHDLDLEYQLVTNNSSNTPAQYVRKLAGMGIETTPDHILNSAIAAARHVSDTQPGASVFGIGGPGVRQAALAHGLDYHSELDIDAADCVIVGWDRDLTWAKLATATRLIHDGATFVGTNPDKTYPLERGLAPGNGAQTAALVAATDVQPVIAGKPAPPLYRQAMERMGTEPETTLVLGDRLDTDILGGVRLGMPTALLLTGIARREELADSPISPTLIVEDLPTLVRTWRAACTAPDTTHKERE